jgi:hypothetical protein
MPAGRFLMGDDAVELGGALPNDFAPGAAGS